MDLNEMATLVARNEHKLVPVIAQQLEVSDGFDTFECVHTLDLVETVKAALITDGLAKRHRISHYPLKNGMFLPYVIKRDGHYLIQIVNCNYKLRLIDDDIQAVIGRNLASN